MLGLKDAQFSIWPWIIIIHVLRQQQIARVWIYRDYFRNFRPKFCMNWQTEREKIVTL